MSVVIWGYQGSRTTRISNSLCVQVQHSPTSNTPLLSPNDVCGEGLLARHDNRVLTLVWRNDSVLIVTVGNDFVSSPLRMRDWYNRAKHLMRNALWTHSRLVWNLMSWDSIWHMYWDPTTADGSHLLIAWWNHLHRNGAHPLRPHHLINRIWLCNECLPLWKNCGLHIKAR